MRRQPQHRSKSLKVSNSSEFPSEKQKRDKLKDKVKTALMVNPYAVWCLHRVVVVKFGNCRIKEKDNVMP